MVLSDSFTKIESTVQKVVFVGPSILDIEHVVGPHIASYYIVQELINQNKEVSFFDIGATNKRKLKNLLSCDAIWFIYPMGRMNGFLVSLIALLLNKNLIVYVNDLPILQFRDLMLQRRNVIKAFTIKLIENFLFFKADFVISTSPYFFDHLRVITKKRIVFPPGFCKNDLFKTYQKNNDLHNNIVLYAGSLDRSGMITKLSTMFRDIEGWCFWIAGKGNEEIDLNQNVRYFGLLPKVKLHDLYFETDVIIIPYPKLEYYNLIIPLKSAESLATNKPIITAKLKGIEAYVDFLGMKENVIFVENWSKSEILKALNIAKSMKRLNQAELHEKMSVYTWEQRTKQLIELVDSNDKITESLTWI